MPELTEYTLYYRLTCPFCVRVLDVAKSLNITLSMKDISEKGEYREELVNGGGKGMVPCLLHPDGTWQYESSDIINFLQSKA